MQPRQNSRDTNRSRTPAIVHVAEKQGFQISLPLFWMDRWHLEALKIQRCTTYHHNTSLAHKWISDVCRILTLWHALGLSWLTTGIHVLQSASSGFTTRRRDVVHEEVKWQRRSKTAEIASFRREQRLKVSEVGMYILLSIIPGSPHI